MKKIKTSSILFPILILCFGAYYALAGHKIEGSLSNSGAGASNSDDLVVISRVGEPIVGNSSISLSTGLIELKQAGNVSNTPDLLPSEALALQNNRISNAPTEFRLFENYPNPFNPATIIRFDIPEATAVTLKIYDIRGQEVATLLNNKQSEPRNYEVRFDASHLSSGIYLYRVVAGDHMGVKKMILLR
jgi:hypothetical protein